MHIAICDDNVADRKQMERLLKRESDKYAAAREPFYIDGYGNPESVLHSPMLYDAFFIDMTASSKNGLDVAKELIEVGVTAPIVLCISAINYSTMSLPDNCFCLQKPVRINDLEDILEILLAACDNKIPHIEIRTETETHYLAPSDVYYVLEDGRFVDVYLTDGSILKAKDTIANLYEEIRHLNCFLPLTFGSVVNAAYVSHAGLFIVRMKNGRRFFLHPTFHKYVHLLLKSYNENVKS